MTLDQWKSTMNAAWVGALVATTMTTTTSAQPALDTRPEITKPVWLKKASGDDYAANYPSEAMQTSKSGRAVIKCIVAADGYLHDCVVLAETPKKLGFGKATVSMSRYWRMSASQTGGKIEGATVTIPIRWQISNSPTPPPAQQPPPILADDAPWVSTPTKEQIVTAFPPAAEGKASRAVVTLKCELGFDGLLKLCGVASAAPTGLGFEAAALDLSSKFKADIDWAIELRENVFINVPIQFAPANDGLWNNRDLGKIEWLQTPDPDMAHALFPAGALKAGIKSGSAKVGCTVAASGALSDCKADSESPQGLGFGTAAEQIAARFVMNPWTTTGLPAGGAHVRMPIELAYEDKAGAPATSAPSPAPKP